MFVQIEVTRNKDLIAWIGFPKRIRNAIIDNKLTALNMNNLMNTTSNDFEIIWIKIPYLSDKRDQLLRS